MQAPETFGCAHFLPGVLEVHINREAALKDPQQIFGILKCLAVHGRHAQPKPFTFFILRRAQLFRLIALDIRDRIGNDLAGLILFVRNAALHHNNGIVVHRLGAFQQHLGKRKHLHRAAQIFYADKCHQAARLGVDGFYAHHGTHQRNVFSVVGVRVFSCKRVDTAIGDLFDQIPVMIERMARKIQPAHLFFHLEHDVVWILRACVRQPVNILPVFRRAAQRTEEIDLSVQIPPRLVFHAFQNALNAVDH